MPGLPQAFTKSAEMATSAWKMVEPLLYATRALPRHRPTRIPAELGIAGAGAT